EMTGRIFDGALDDVHADAFVVVVGLDRLDRRQAADQRHATAGDDAFFDRGAGRVQGVFDAGFLFLHLSLGRGADIDDGHAAGEFRQAFLQFFAGVIRGGVLDLTADLVDAGLDLRALAVAFSDRGVVFVDDDALGPSVVIQFDGRELDAEV